MPIQNPLLAPVIRDLYEHEAEELHARITALTRCPAATMLRPHADAHHPRSPKAVLKRILTHYHQTKVQELEAAFNTDEQGWSYRWRSAIGTLHHMKPQPPEACMHWISAAPMLATLAMPAPVLRWAWRRLLGVPDPKPEAVCQRILPSGQRCACLLDALGHHELNCHHGMWQRRHNSVAHHLAALGRAAGQTVLLEQGAVVRQQRPTQARPTRTADVQMIDSTGNMRLNDVRCTARPAMRDMTEWLTRHERLKRKEYSLPEQTFPAALCDSVRPFVLDVSGFLSPCALAVVDLMQLAAQRRMLTSAQPWSRAIHEVRRDFLTPLSISLIKMQWQCHLLCTARADFAAEEPSAAASSERAG